MPEPDTQPNPDFMPQLHAIANAYSDITAFNQRFSGLGSAINDRIANARVYGDGDEAEIDDYAFIGLTFTDLKQGQEEAEMNADLNTLVNEDTFSRIGIEIMPLGSTFGTDDASFSTTKLAPRISNVALYKEFLSKIPKGTILATDDSLLSATMEILDLIVTTCFDTKSREKISPESLGNVSQLGLDSLRAFTEIQDQYSRLGLDPESIHQYLLDQPDDGYDHRQAARGLSLARAYDSLEHAVELWGQRLLPGIE